MSNVLLVSDDTWVQNDVTAALTDPGITLTVEADPRQALSTAGERDYTVILIDMQVGSMGGIAVTRALNDAIHNDDLATTPIVILLDRAADAFIARRGGATASLAKPFTSQDLRAAIDEVLADSHA